MARTRKRSRPMSTLEDQPLHPDHREMLDADEIRVGERRPQHPNLRRGPSPGPHTLVDPPLEPVLDLPPNRPCHTSPVGENLAHAKKVRGQTQALDIWARAINVNQIKIEVSPNYAFVGDDVQMLTRFKTSFINCQARMPFMIQLFDDSWVPVTWDDPYLDQYKEDALYHILGRFRFFWSGTNERVPDKWVKYWILRDLNDSWGNKKSNTYRNCVKDKTLEFRMAKKPDGWEEYWIALCEFFDSDEHQLLSKRGIAARASHKNLTTLGSTSSEQWAYKKEKATGRKPTRVDKHDQLHRRKDGTWVSELAANQSARMHEYADETKKIEEEQGYPGTDPQRQMIADDAIYFVIGPDKHGRVKYMGRHMSKSRYFRAQHPTIVPLTQQTQAERTPPQSTPVRNPSVQSTSTQSIQRQTTPMESSPIPSTTASVPQHTQDRYSDLLNWFRTSGIPLPEGHHHPSNGDRP